MPGIAGIISRQLSKKNEDDLNLMIGCMMHEPFYTSGAYINEQLGLYAGWVSHKGSFSDCMPVFNERKDQILLFSGENFADKEVTEQLKKRGHEFDSSNASYLIHLYEEQGEAFLQNLNGWFNGILIDLEKNNMFLFNDRYGMQKIYYHESKDNFIFSSEAKALLKISPTLRDIDLRGLGEFFSCNCVLENRTLFHNIFLLPAGSSWKFQNDGSVKKDFYFRPSIWEDQPALEEGVFYERLRGIFCRILPRYFYAKQPIAMSLTGGLDTRLILSSIDTLPGELPTYTFSSIYRDSFDVRISRKVANACHQTHHVLRLDKKFFSDFQNLAAKTIYVTDGCLDVCGTHVMYLNRLAREIAPIRITGTFGGEVLKSVTGFKAIFPCESLLCPDFKKYLLQAERTFIDIKKVNKLSCTLFKEAPWLINNIISSEQSQLTYRTPYMDNDFVELMYQAPSNIRTSNKIRIRLIKDSNPALFKIMTDMGFGGGYNFVFSKSAQLLYWVLFKAEWYYGTGMPHWLAKLDYTFAPLHPERLILGRHKYEHYRMWFKNEISDFMREILLDKRTHDRSYLNKEFLEEIVLRHIKGDRNYVNEINKALTVELIHRLLIENI